MTKYLTILLLSFVIALPVAAKNGGKGDKPKSLPPGLAKKVERGKELPPGWRKKLILGTVLDTELYGIAIKITRSPSSVYPKIQPHTELLRIEDKIIRIQDDTRKILEIFGLPTP